MNWLDDDENQEFELIPEGKYDAVVTDVQLDETKDDPRVSLTFTIDNGKFKNRKLWQNFYFNDKGKKWVGWQTRLLEIANIMKEKKPAGPQEAARVMLDAAGTILNVNTYRIEVTQDEWDGKVRNKIKVQSRIQADISAIKNEAPTFNSNEQIPF